MISLRKAFDAVLSALYPDRCAVCGEVIESGKRLCESCKDEVFPIFGDICHNCGVGLDCHDKTRCRSFEAPVIAAYYYRGAVRNLIIDFKDTRSVKAFGVFSPSFFERIAREYSDIDFDITVCVPSEGKKKGTSRIISEETAKRFLLGFDKDVLEKYRHTEKQHRLKTRERFHNLENSIRVREGKEAFVKDKTVLLCDDVKTTGSTLSECAKALYKAGAKKVYCACIAVSDYGTLK